MTPFNPKDKKQMTYEECLGPAMLITDQEDADQYLEAYLKSIQEHLDETKSEDSAERIAKSNLGYWAGYHSHEVRERVEKLFKCSHPVFGSIKDNGAPTPQQAFDAGKKLGKKLSKKK